MSQPISRWTQRVDRNSKFCSMLQSFGKRTCFLSSIYSQTSFTVDHHIDYMNVVRAPFENYSLTAFAFVIEKATNTAMPIVTFVVGEALNFFDISSNGTETKNNYTYDSGSGPTTIEVDSRVAYILVTRSMFAQILTMGLLIINLALTTASVYIMLITVYTAGGAYEGVLLLPVTIILTIPTLRDLYPGSPPLGIYLGKSQALRS